MYAIVDIETTGIRFKRDRIIEIAIVLHDGECVVDSFESLINPDCVIPPHITGLTGISNEMVADAPYFYEIAKKIVEMTEGAIFVAHNVRFDYSFIRKEFQDLGFRYLRKQLCTVRLSRKLLPGLKRYNLDTLIQQLNLPMDPMKRHRAMGDTLATVALFELLTRTDSEETFDIMVNRGVSAAKLPNNITLEQLHELPESCGVYYMHNSEGQIIYVGKSINIKNRIMEHFANQTNKALRMQKSIHDISCVETGSELVALLLESNEIKRLQPVYNTAQKRTHYKYGIFKWMDNDGVLRLGIDSLKNKTEAPEEAFEGKRECLSVLRKLARDHKLCYQYCAIEKSNNKPCFGFQLKQCEGICCAKESHSAYNKKVEAAAAYLSRPFKENFAIVDKGPSQEELSVVMIDNYHYCGHGFLSKEEADDWEQLADCIKYFPSTPDVTRIIRRYLHSGKRFQKIPAPTNRHSDY